jgi:hypothetical protein
MKTKAKTKTKATHGGTRPNAGRPPKAPRPSAHMPIGPATPVDPIAILESIAVDRLTPATARVNACKALLANRASGPKPATPADDLSARAIAIMARGAARSLQ